MFTHASRILIVLSIVLFVLAGCSSKQQEPNLSMASAGEEELKTRGGDSAEDEFIEEVKTRGEAKKIPDDEYIAELDHIDNPSESVEPEEDETGVNEEEPKKRGWIRDPLKKARETAGIEPKRINQRKPPPRDNYYTIRIQNRFEEPIYVAIHYKTIDGYWRTTEFRYIRSGESRNMGTTRNARYFYVAKSRRYEPYEGAGLHRQWWPNRNTGYRFNVEGQDHSFYDAQITRRGWGISTYTIY